MTIRRFLLLPSDPDTRQQKVHDLVLKHHRKKNVTMGWVEDVYPNERGWVDQPGNRDRRRRVFYALIKARDGKNKARLSDGIGRLSARLLKPHTVALDHHALGFEHMNNAVHAFS